MEIAAIISIHQQATRPKKISRFVNRVFLEVPMSWKKSSIVA
jgi:hypothetical protein